MEEIDVGARVRRFRHIRGLSQEQLALEAGINPAFLGHLERGLKSPTITTLDKLVRALNITFEELFADEICELIPEREFALERVRLLVKDLSVPQLEAVADIIQATVKFASVHEEGDAPLE